MSVDMIELIRAFDNSALGRVLNLLVDLANAAGSAAGPSDLWTLEDIKTRYHVKTDETMKTRLGDLQPVNKGQRPELWRANDVAAKLG